MEQVRQPITAKGSEVFALYSPVTIDSNGFLVVSTAGTKIFGYVTEAFTAISTNSSGIATAGVTQQNDPTVFGYAPRVIGVENVDFWADSDQAFTQTDMDVYADIASVSSGVVTIDLAAGATGQFKVLGLLSNLDPAAEGDTDRIIVRVAEPQMLGFAQT